MFWQEEYNLKYNQGLRPEIANPLKMKFHLLLWQQLPR